MKSKRPIIITDPTGDIAFRAGVLNCLENGNLLICSEPNKVQSFAENFKNEIDLITSEQIDKLDERIRVIVPHGSPLYKGRANRLEI